MTVGDLGIHDAHGNSASSTPDSVSAPRSGLVNHPRRLARRPSSVRRESQTNRPSIVQQKLHAAIQSGERAAADLVRVESNQSSFRARGIASAAAAERGESDRSVSRYRNDAAIVSFTDPPSSSASASLAGFCYSINFMPGVHFYTFLASKDASSTAVPSTTARGPPSPARNQATTAVTQSDGAECESTRVKSSGLRMWIPDTVVYGETGRAALLYTDENGFVQRSMEVSDKIVLERLAVQSCSDLDPIIVCKEPTTAPAKKAEGNALAYHGNLLRLLSPGELKTVLSNVSSTRSTKAFALQKFVRCNGSKAFIVRAVHDAGKPPYAWMINNTAPFAEPAPTVSQVLLSLGQDASVANSVGATGVRSKSVVASVATAENGSGNEPEAISDPVAAASNAVPLVNRVCTSVQVDKSCTFIKLSERGCTKVAELNKRLVKFIEHRLRLQLQTLVADYTKDSDGRWWLLQVKHFRVRSTSNPAKPYYSLPRRFRLQYLGYRDSSLVEETADSDEEHDRLRRAAEVAAQMTQRQVRKLTQCKCCLAAYPKEELSFKMTLKMINEMLVRIRSRLPPEKTYTFLTAALARESTDPSLAYESWSVCSYCYAIYERDQHLQKVETKFAESLGAPDQHALLGGLAKLDERAVVIDPNATSTVLPAQLTLCRLMLVISGIYDIPPELYEAERDSVEVIPNPAPTLHVHRSFDTVASRLYLRISALGYTECIPVDPADICISHEKAPRGTRRRRSSAASMLSGNESDDGDESGDENPRSSRGRGGRNYWLPIHLIRTVHFFAPRTPLHAKLKETSGLTPFLNEDNSISIQFVRATEPPLQDPTPIATTLAERGRNRRTALQPQPLASGSATKSEPTKASASMTHTVLLGATKLRMAQFRSAYVTKLDFYACMALTGEMFNIKGNLGLERVRYMDTKLLTSRYRLRAYNGVYIPDASFVPSDPLTSEWMDCLRALASVPSQASIPLADETLELKSRRESRQGAHSPNGEPRNDSIRRSVSITSLSAGNEDMDEELEEMIDHAGRERPCDLSAKRATQKLERVSVSSPMSNPSPDVDMGSWKHQLPPASKPTSQVDSQMSMLLNKQLISPPSKPPQSQPADASSPLSPTPQNVLWALIIQLNHVHNLQSRERPYCRWECYYELFGQRRSAVERSSTTRPGSPPNRDPETLSELPADDDPVAMTEVSFSCTHRFFLSASSSRLTSHLRSNSSLILNLRNDVYTSTRSRTTGEFFCKLDLSGLMSSKVIDATVDILASASAPPLTPREAALVSRAPPYLSLSVHLSQLTMDPREGISNGDFVVVGSTIDGIQVLKKIT